MSNVAVSFLIPVYNEGDCVGATVQGLRRVSEQLHLTSEIIVIDDGSTDQNAALDHMEGVRLIRHPVNRGYGRALKSGISHAAYDWCAIIDADGSYPAERFADLLARIPQFDMVVGARTGKIYWGSWFKRINRHILHWMVKFVVGQQIPDVNSGMRIFRKDIAISHFRRISSGFSFTTTLTLAMLLDERFVGYIPIDYHPRVGSSKVKMRVDSMRMLQILSQAIIYYNPLKMFLLMCTLNLLLGVGMAVVVTLVGSLGLGWLCLGIFITVSILLGGLGFLAEALRLSRD
jgi:polyisoprenyl-phosphate glycosyltransferase